ncbi:hypothetical protein [Methylomonas sp. TEB]|uniref:hypothetical protein n=1 Tax=Methylomonas sp. TEB TaxID=3398229 RepID=UPI0039F4CEBF
MRLEDKVYSWFKMISQSDEEDAISFHHCAKTSFRPQRVQTNVRFIEVQFSDFRFDCLARLEKLERQEWVGFNNFPFLKTVIRQRLKYL